MAVAVVTVVVVPVLPPVEVPVMGFAPSIIMKYDAQIGRVVGVVIPNAPAFAPSVARYVGRRRASQRQGAGDDGSGKGGLKQDGLRIHRSSPGNHGSKENDPGLR
jgi:hypothetical protein